MLFLVASIVLFVALVTVVIALAHVRARLRDAQHVADAAAKNVAALQQRLAEADASLRATKVALGTLESEHESLRNTSASQLVQAKHAFNRLKSDAVARLQDLNARATRLLAANAALSRWQPIVDVEAKVSELRLQAQREIDRMNAEAQAEIAAARSTVSEIKSEGRRLAAEHEVIAARRLGDLETKITQKVATAREGLSAEVQRARANASAARKQAERIIRTANEAARSIAGEAWDAKVDLDRLRRLAAAMENQVAGYGTRYLVPMRAVLDELGAEMAHTDAGQGLKSARATTRAMVETGRAAACDYADGERRNTATRFVLDAFNGKVEAILSKSKAENAGTIAQQVRDAYEVVNHLGSAFRNARIRPEYLEARLEEARWAALAQHAKELQREEQRRTKEQLREEAQVQKELQRAIKETERQEAELAAERKRIEAERAQAAAEERAKMAARLADELRRASESQRAELEARFLEEARLREEQAQRAFDAQLSQMESELKELKEVRERKISMAQQRKSGTVYIISNVGSFGERVFKVGQTRREVPMERIDELGDASVPFSFDVHALIATEDAPRLEGAIHTKLIEHQVNKMNWRKEFFRVDLGVIRSVVDELGVSAEWTMEAAAEDYRNTLALESKMAVDPVERERWMAEQLGVEVGVLAMADD